MDAPQISTLRQDSEPPQSVLQAVPRRVKLLVGKSGTSSTSQSATTRPIAHDEEEEDQLVDDEEPSERHAATPSPAKKQKITLKKRASKAHKAEARMQPEFYSLHQLLIEPFSF